MASWRQQALIAAPVEEVWELLVEPERWREWGEDVNEVTGGPVRIEKGSMVDVRGRGPLRLPTTAHFKVEDLEELKEVHLKCQVSGFYSHWLLTEARGSTFADVELGVEPMPGLQARAAGMLHTKGYLRGAVERSIDGIRRAVRRPRGESTAP
jgi:Polyketide cyclase / dehydrase and lipid transport